MKSILKYSISFLLIVLLSSCQLGGYGSPSVEASNGISPPTQQVVVSPTLFGASGVPVSSGPSAVAAERAAKSKAFYGGN